MTAEPKPIRTAIVGLKREVADRLLGVAAVRGHEIRSFEPSMEGWSAACRWRPQAAIIGAGLLAEGFVSKPASGSSDPVLLVVGEGGCELPERAIGIPASASEEDIALDLLRVEQRVRGIAEFRSLRPIARAVEIMQLGVTITDLSGRIVYVNSADARMHGYKIADLIGQDIVVYVPGGKRRPLSQEQIQKWRRWRRESTNRRRSGTVFPVMLFSDAVFDENGEPAGLVTICEEISARKAVEAALGASQANLAAVIESSADAIWAVDRELRLIAFNQGFNRIFAPYLLEEAQVGIEWRGILPDSIQTQWNELFSRALAGEKLTDEMVIEIAGKLRVHSVSLNPIFAEGKVTGACLFARDISEQRAAEAALRASEARHEAARGAVDGLWHWNLETRAVSFSSRWKSMLGYAQDEIGDGMDAWLDLVHPDDRDLLWQEITRHLDGSTEEISFEHRIRAKDGSYRYVLCRGRAIRGDEGIARVTGSQIDVTDRRKAMDALRASEERYALAARGANDGLWDWDIEQGALYLSPRCLDLLELSGPVTIEDWFSAVHVDDRERFRREMERHLLETADGLEVEFRVPLCDGGLRWLLCRGLALRGYLGEASRIAGSVTDITARKRMEEQLLHDAFHDALTGLPNRALFLDHLELAMKRAERNSGHRFAVLFMDLDRFKMVNDGLGHVAGDDLLVETGRRLQGALRSVDTLARLGGDEFALLLDGIEEEDVPARVAERIRESLKEPFLSNGQEVVLSMSIGIAHSTMPYEKAEEILRDADIAMYRAKADAPGGHRTFDVEMHERAVAMLQTETDLRRAVVTDQLRVYYQPVVDLRGGVLRGFEALVRWQHPDRGLVPPFQFIPIAEESDLIVEIGEWVIERVCDQLELWGGNERLTVTVNISARQCRDAGLSARIIEALKKRRLSSSCLGVELTESILMENSLVAGVMLQELRAAGVKSYLDDFGTGYSSLSYLHRFRFDLLKIDRSFVQRLSEDREIIRTILSLARNMKMGVVAEGIETMQQRLVLEELGCGFGQGYLFAKPLPVAEATALLVSNRTF